MKALNKKLEKLLAVFCAGLMLLMVLDVSWQVFSRFILNDPSSFSEELARFLLIWIGFLGGAYAYRQYAHLGLDIIVSNLDGLKKRIVEGLSDVVCFLFSVIVLMYGGMKMVILTLDLQQLSAALQIKMGYVYLAIPLGGLLIMLFSLERILHGRHESNLVLTHAE